MYWEKLAVYLLSKPKSKNLSSSMSDRRPTTPGDWVQPLGPNGFFMGRQVVPLWSSPVLGGTPASTAEATITTTATTTTTTTDHSNINLNAEGRVGKSAKKRSRASRKGPTTLFNTSTANFRAMVQQFTGAPAAPSARGSQTGAPILNFGLGGNGLLGPYQGMMVPPSQPFSIVQQPQPYQHQQLQHVPVLQRGGEPVFSYGNSRPSSNMGVSEAFLEGMSSYGQASNEGNSNGLHFDIREDRFRNQY